MLAALAGVILCGCSHSKDDRIGGGYAGSYAAQPPAFLNGPMNVLLTNTGGFTAHLTVQGDPFALDDGLKSGQLLCQGSKLVFAPAQNKSKKKQVRAGGFAFIWDVANSRGFVLSGALEGYAPVSASSHATNVVVQPKGAAEKIDGHSATTETAVVNMSDGSSDTFDVWRARDLNAFPVRITATGTGVPVTLLLSDIHLSPPPNEVFAPPEEFTKYSSPEAMADEVVARQHNLHRKSTGSLDQMEPLYRQQQPPANR
jgi:hypothetical protein